MQNTERYIGIIPSTNVDISTDEIIAFARKENIENTISPNNDILTKIGEKYPTLTEFQKAALRIVSR